MGNSELGWFLVWTVAAGAAIGLIGLLAVLLRNTVREFRNGDRLGAWLSLIRRFVLLIISALLLIHIAELVKP